MLKLNPRAHSLRERPSGAGEKYDVLKLIATICNVFAAVVNYGISDV